MSQRNRPFRRFLLQVLLIAASLVVTSLPLSAQGTSPIQVWAVPGISKVRPDAKIEGENLVWSSKDRTVRLKGAANEHVPFQVIVTAPPPPNRYVPPLSGLWVEATGLTGPDGSIPESSVALFFEHVVLAYGKSSPVGDTGFWPDALAPLTDPFDMGASFRSAVQNRAVWVDIFIPKDAQAGEYSGSVTVSHNGKPVDRINVNLEVYGFSLPDETHLFTYMGVSPNGLAAQHDLDRSSPEMRILLKSYHEFLQSHRMEPWFNWMLQPQISVVGGQVSLQFDEETYRYYMDDLGTKRVVLEAVPRELVEEEESDRSPESAVLVRSYVKQLVEFFESHGWLDRLVVNSPIDEPNTASHYEQTRYWADLVHEVAPQVPFLVTESPITDNPAWGELTGHANNFSIHGNELNRPEVKAAIRNGQAEGSEFSWYISCDQVYPQPNYFIDAPAMDPVMVPWITYRYGMQGMLYWALNFWTQTPDPWIDPVTYLSGFLCSEGGILNGEGSLLYPGNRARRYTGQQDVAGPVSSIRFELLRDGLEDYEYLWLLESLGDRDFAQEAAKNLVVDVSTFSRNLEELMATRERMARRIEQLVREGQQPH